MGQPNPPEGDSPLFEGLGSEWNDIVSAFPEDQRNELAPKLKERIDQYEPLKQWSDFQQAGVTPDQATQAINLYKTFETNPQFIYEELGKHLGITPQQAQEVVEDNADVDPRDSKLEKLEKQLETITQIMMGERQQTMQEQQVAQQQKELEKQFDSLRKKYGDIDEEEVLMRMLHLNMTPEQAYQAYTEKHNSIKQRRPTPMLLGSGNAVPRPRVDPTKLDSVGTKNLVAQMLQAGVDEAKK